MILYVHDRGKANLAGEPLVERLVLSEGFRILAVDLRGMGETARGWRKVLGFSGGKTDLRAACSDIRSILRWLSADARRECPNLGARGQRDLCVDRGRDG